MKILAFVLGLIISTPLFATNSTTNDDKNFAKLYADAEYHILYENYELALPLYLQLHDLEPTNANINFKIGYCYLNIPGDKLTALPYLKEAVKNASPKYLEFESGEKRAPISAYYFMAKAYHHNYQFDSAIVYYDLFRPHVKKSDSEQLDDLDHQISSCNYGKELVKSPVEIKMKNLGDSINGKYPEYSPALTADERMLIFTSRRDGSTGDRRTDDGQFYEDIYVSHRLEDGSWQKAYHLGENVNRTDHDAALSVSADGGMVFIYRSVSKEDGDIYVSKLDGEFWGFPEKLGSDINTKHWETHASMSADGRTLFFISNRPGGIGGRDIYRVNKLPNGEWSKAVNLGAGLNTKYDEDGVFIHPNGKDLYFASQGHKTMGGFDLFLSVMNEDGTWGAPKNLGYPINSTDDDVFFVTSADGKRAYYASDHEGGFGEKDIYVAELGAPEASDITLVNGKLILLDGNTKIPGGNSVTVTFVSDGEVYAVSKARTNGRYVLALPPGKDFTINYEVDGYVAKVEKFSVPNTKGYNEIIKDIELMPIGGLAKKEEPKKAELPDNASKSGNDTKDKGIPTVKESGESSEYDVFFGYNRRKIDVQNEEFVKFINYLENQFKAGNTIKINIEASASKVPTSKYRSSNKELAKRRGVAARKLVTQELAKRGVVIGEKMKFSKIVYGVNGPAYDGNSFVNKKKYEPYQYVKIRLSN